MKRDNLLAISIIVLAMSILGGSIWIGYSLQNIKRTETIPPPFELREKGLLTEVEASEYLSITVDELRSILIQDSIEKLNLTSYFPYEFLPYLELDSGVKLFNNKELDEWISYNMHNK